MTKILHTLITVTVREAAWRLYGAPVLRVVVMTAGAVLVVIHPLLAFALVIPCLILWGIFRLIRRYPELFLCLALWAGLWFLWVHDPRHVHDALFSQFTESGLFWHDN